MADDTKALKPDNASWDVTPLQAPGINICSFMVPHGRDLVEI